MTCQREASAFFEQKRKEFCDITLEVGERSLSANRIILAAAIPYFYKMFSEKEVSDTKGKSVTFPDVDPDALESLIEYAYTFKVKITVENVKMLLIAACHLQVDEVKNICCKFLEDRLNSENVLNIRKYSSDLYCSELVDKIDCYISENFVAMSLTNEFWDIPFSLLNQVIASENLNVKSEVEVFEIALKWIKKCPVERRDNLPELLKNIRFSEIEPCYIRNHMLKEELIRSSIACRDLLDDAMYYHATPKKRADFIGEFSIKPRCVITNYKTKKVNENSGMYIMYSEIKQSIQCFDTVKENWQTTVSHNFALGYEHTASKLNRKMYYFLPSLTYVHDLEENISSFCTGMTLPRTWAGSVAHSGRFYVCGGCCENKGENSQTRVVECFDPESKQWTQLKSMSVSRGAPSVVNHARSIYAFGGKHSDSNALQSAEKYCLQTETWSMVPSMLTKRCAASCATLNDKIYICGGESSVANDAISTAEVFDPTTNEWKFISSMNTPRACLKVLSFRGKLYALGGKAGENKTNEVEIYEPESNAWTYGQKTDDKLIIVGAAVLSLRSA